MNAPRLKVLSSRLNHFAGVDRITIRAQLQEEASPTDVVRAAKALGARQFDAAETQPGALAVQVCDPGDEDAVLCVLAFTPYGDWSRAMEAAAGGVPVAHYAWSIMSTHLEFKDIDPSEEPEP